MAKAPLVDMPHELSAADRSKIRVWCDEYAPQLSRRLAGEYILCRNWHRENSVKRRKPVLAFQNWLVKADVGWQDENQRKRRQSEPEALSSEVERQLELIAGGKE